MTSTQGQNTGQQASDRWARRPRRSVRDRKIAGVAGGLGRAFGIDPILLRVAFVVLTIFGGVGGLIYVLGWLLLPADNDEVSGAEALIGRGRSSMSPALTVGLCLLALAGVASSFSWGLPFWPLLIGVGVLVIVGKKNHKGPFRPGGPWHQQWQTTRTRWDGGQGPGAPDPWHPRASSGHPGRSAAPADAPAPASPFDTPAFWDDSEKTAAPTPAAAEPRTTPPAWDPLGAAPFAWDLPDVDLTPPPPPTRRPSWVARWTLPFAFVAGALAAAGVVYDWWTLSWAQVSGIALGVVALGLFLASLRGRGSALIGPGIALAVVTVCLSITGISGTSGYGEQSWRPTTVAQLAPEYRLNAGDASLDLTGMTIPAGQTRSVVVSLGAGNATVNLPESMAVSVNCTVTAGDADCLGVTQQGLNLGRDPVTADLTGAKDTGRLLLTVQVGAGQATVTRG